MRNERYSCSKSIMRANWWGKVIGLKLTDSLARIFISLDSPSDPPMTKESDAPPRSKSFSSNKANAGESYSFLPRSKAIK